MFLQLILFWYLILSISCYSYIIKIHSTTGVWCNVVSEQCSLITRSLFLFAVILTYLPSLFDKLKSHTFQKSYCIVEGTCNFGCYLLCGNNKAVCAAYANLAPQIYCAKGYNLTGLYCSFYESWQNRSIYKTQMDTGKIFCLYFLDRLILSIIWNRGADRQHIHSYKYMYHVSSCKQFD